MNIKVKFNNKIITVPNIKKAEGFTIFKGLMFASKNNSNALLFNIKSSLHSFFVFFPFLVLWLDNKNKIIDFRVVKPFSLYINTNMEYSKILEIPISKKYLKVVKFAVEQTDLNDGKIGKV